MHSCPDCGQACTCGGDIDDMMIDDGAAAQRCTHWKQCFDPYDGQDPDEEDYEP